MKIGIISGSHRSPSQSEKVANYMSGCLIDEGVKTWVYPLAKNPLPLWDQSIWEGEKAWSERLQPVKNELSECDGFIIISPEWHGQVPSGLKNFFLFFGHAEFGHKPALLVSVSSGDGGAYPIAELRMSSYKNNRICYLPEHLILRKVEKILNEDPNDNDESLDSYYRERINWTLGILKGYTTALKPMRDTTQIFHDKFGYGM
ncbi:MAG: NAD(P)H-dependent oxidoreductase [Gammaproteobacteria bacterium]|nr:NAD(P)H-dependent oxidoreductase [Gammaproteobacteria bacterium]